MTSFLKIRYSANGLLKNRIINADSIDLVDPFSAPGGQFSDEIRSRILMKDGTHYDMSVTVEDIYRILRESGAAVAEIRSTQPERPAKSAGPLAPVALYTRPVADEVKKLPNGGHVPSTVAQKSSAPNAAAIAPNAVAAPAKVQSNGSGHATGQINGQPNGHNNGSNSGSSNAPHNGQAHAPGQATGQASSQGQGPARAAPMAGPATAAPLNGKANGKGAPASGFVNGAGNGPANGPAGAPARSAPSNAPHVPRQEPGPFGRKPSPTFAQALAEQQVAAKTPAKGMGVSAVTSAPPTARAQTPMKSGEVTQAPATTGATVASSSAAQVSSPGPIAVASAPPAASTATSPSATAVASTAAVQAVQAARRSSPPVKRDGRPTPKSNDRAVTPAPTAPAVKVLPPPAGGASVAPDAAPSLPVIEAAAQAMAQPVSPTASSEPAVGAAAAAKADAQVGAALQALGDVQEASRDLEGADGTAHADRNSGAPSPMPVTLSVAGSVEVTSGPPRVTTTLAKAPGAMKPLGKAARKAMAKGAQQGPSETVPPEKARA